MQLHHMPYDPSMAYFRREPIAADDRMVDLGGRKSKGASIRQPVILIDSAVLALVSLETIRVRDLLMMVRRIFQHVSW